MYFEFQPLQYVRIAEQEIIKVVKIKLKQLALKKKKKNNH